MGKYSQLFSVSWQNGFVYRTSVFLWRFRNFLATFMSLTVWSLLLAEDRTVVGYTQSTATTYIFIISLLQSVVLSTSLHGLSDFIYSGGLSNILCKPISVFGYLTIQELTDKLKNFGFVVIETMLLWAIFAPQLQLPQIWPFLLFLLWTAGAVYLNMLVLLALGSIGFWSPETWAPRFIFFILLDFTAGKLFPLDILPLIVQRILFMSPLPYLSFVQTQLFLGKISPEGMIHHSLSLSVWILIGTILLRRLWQQGMKEYTAAGQ